MDRVSIQLGAFSCVAAAYALHPDGGTCSSFLYVLASLSTEDDWDVTELQLVTNALLDHVLGEGSADHRYVLLDRSEDVGYLLRRQ